jgi:hypothetical protein
MRRLMSFSIGLAVLAFSSGCGASAASPNSPTILGGGASISGAITTGSGAGFRVSVAGTSMSQSCDGQGKFSFSVAPAGEVKLHFSGPGVETDLALPNVAQDETIELGVSFSGGTATVDRQVRIAGTRAAVEGRIEARPPTTASRTIQVANRMILTDGSTEFLIGDAPSSFIDMLEGARVQIDATNAGTLIAKRIVLRRGQ